mmetsp:Transcript_1696/g.5546  ORF Transcript_1696/g.5546 Transcript_1696/m.5546 type:complete len:203 (-) Transcript_1696:1006-1614(-)|eukprot:scaffold9592_cov118-Isochrysis_galbana.AAC.6
MQRAGRGSHRAQAMSSAAAARDAKGEYSPRLARGSALGMIGGRDGAAEQTRAIHSSPRVHCARGGNCQSVTLTRRHAEHVKATEPRYPSGDVVVDTVAGSHGRAGACVPRSGCGSLVQVIRTRAVAKNGGRRPRHARLLLIDGAHPPPREADAMHVNRKACAVRCMRPDRLWAVVAAGSNVDDLSRRLDQPRRARRVWRDAA